MLCRNGISLRPMGRSCLRAAPNYRSFSSNSPTQPRTETPQQTPSVASLSHRLHLLARKREATIEPPIPPATDDHPQSLPKDLTPKERFLWNVDRFLTGTPIESPRSTVRDKLREVYAHTDTPLLHVKMYGFDYDFTLAAYKSTVLSFIYDEAKKYLVEHLGYPREILNKSYDKNFAIRGLFYDEKTGYLMKLDQFGKIQIETVHHGRNRVMNLHDITKHYRSIIFGAAKRNMRMMTDIFCLPEACLLADVAQVFLDKKADHSSSYISQDIRDALDFIHGSGLLHDSIVKNPAHYLDENPLLGTYLQKLRAAGKKVFLLTNSPYKFVNAGMMHMLREPIKTLGLKDWKDFFDIVICNARKPSFFDRDARFRKLDVATDTLSVQAMNEFRRGEIYTEGGLLEFTRLTGMTGVNVLYMGDHVFSDLVRPTRTALWKTAAIIKELKEEIATMNTPQFRDYLYRSLQMDELINYGQRLEDPESVELVRELKKERDAIRVVLREMFNKYFGSPFRTSSHRSMFFFNVGIYADIYTSSITNFLDYPMNYCFYAGRTVFPHELSGGMVSGQASTPMFGRQTWNSSS